MVMHFHALVDEIRELSLEEKQEMRSLLGKFVAEEQRAAILSNYQESLEELEKGQLEFSSDTARLKRMLDD
jgi:hypothetical protein